MLSRLFVAVALPLTLGSQIASAQDAAIGFGQGDFDRSAPVEVSADTLEVDQTSGRAVLTGTVVIAQGDLRLSADRVVVDYATVGGEREIETMNATGDVVIVAGEDAAEGETAIYTLATTDIIMTGDVIITQAGNVLAGDRVAINLESGAGTVTGRVRTTLQP